MREVHWNGRNQSQDPAHNDHNLDSLEVVSRSVVAHGVLDHVQPDRNTYMDLCNLLSVSPVNINTDKVIGRRAQEYDLKTCDEATHTLSKTKVIPTKERFY